MPSRPSKLSVKHEYTSEDMTMFSQAIYSQLLINDESIEILNPVTSEQLVGTYVQDEASPLKNDKWQKIIIPVSQGGIQGGHWVSYVLEKEGDSINVYYLNSIFDDAVVASGRQQKNPNKDFIEKLQKIFPKKKIVEKEYVGCLRQQGNVTCGIYALINAANCISGGEAFVAPTTEQEARKYALDLVQKHYAQGSQALAAFEERQYNENEEVLPNVTQLPQYLEKQKDLQHREAGAYTLLKNFIHGLSQKQKTAVDECVKEIRRDHRDFSFAENGRANILKLQELFGGFIAADKKDASSLANPVMPDYNQAGAWKLNTNIYESYDLVFTLTEKIINEELVKFPDDVMAKINQLTADTKEVEAISKEGVNDAEIAKRLQILEFEKAYPNVTYSSIEALQKGVEEAVDRELGYYKRLKLGQDNDRGISVRGAGKASIGKGKHGRASGTLMTSQDDIKLRPTTRPIEIR